MRAQLLVQGITKVLQKVSGHTTGLNPNEPMMVGRKHGQADSIGSRLGDQSLPFAKAYRDKQPYKMEF